VSAASFNETRAWCDERGCMAEFNHYGTQKFAFVVMRRRGWFVQRRLFAWRRRSALCPTHSGRIATQKPFSVDSSPVTALDGAIHPNPQIEAQRPTGQNEGNEP